jgi:hypothetical protein
VITRKGLPLAAGTRGSAAGDIKMRHSGRRILRPTGIVSRLTA